MDANMDIKQRIETRQRGGGRAPDAGRPGAGRHRAGRRGDPGPAGTDDHPCRSARSSGRACAGPSAARSSAWCCSKAGPAHRQDAEPCWTRGEIRLEPNHHHQAVGPMAGTISPSLPVFVVENKAFGNRAFCRKVEGHAAVRRLLGEGPGRPALLAGRGCAGHAGGRAPGGRAHSQADHRPGPADGRRAAQPPQRALQPVRQRAGHSAWSRRCAAAGSC